MLILNRHQFEVSGGGFIPDCFLPGINRRAAVHIVGKTNRNHFLVRISIIVPVLNEAAIIRGFLEDVRAAAPGAEIIVVDGGSCDDTLAPARDLAHDVVEGPCGRAQQMNAGALRARG